jgi:hypothetical protein
MRFFYCSIISLLSNFAWGIDISPDMIKINYEQLTGFFDVNGNYVSGFEDAFERHKNNPAEAMKELNDFIKKIPSTPNTFAIGIHQPLVKAMLFVVYHARTGDQANKLMESAIDNVELLKLFLSHDETSMNYIQYSLLIMRAFTKQKSLETHKKITSYLKEAAVLARSGKISPKIAAIVLITQALNTREIERKAQLASCIVNN